MTLRIGSVCTGYGGLDEAVQQVFGGELAWVSDIDPGARRIIDHRMPGVPNIGDLRFAHWARTLRQYGPVDVLCGGYPCQPFSLAGELKGTADARHLWPFIASALRVLRPRYAIFENVANHLRLGFDTVLTDLADIGFDAEWCVVRADEVGAPHQRRRLIFLATATDAPRPGRAWEGIRGQLAEHGAAAAYSDGLRGERSGARRRGRHEPAAHGRSAAHSDRGGLARLTQRNSGPDNGQPELGPAVDADRRGVQRTVAEPACPTCGCSESFHDAGGFCAGPCGGTCTDPELGRPDEAAADTPGDGRGEGRTEPAGQQGGLGIASRSRAAVADATGHPRRLSHGDHGTAADTNGNAVRQQPVSESGSGRATVAERRRSGSPADTHGGRRGPDERDVQQGQSDAAWGRFLPAVRRWERVLGRLAPRATDDRNRLSPAFVEWMMGLPYGHVTAVPGLTRTQQLKALGNGVVPQQAIAALRLLAERAGVAA